MYLENILEILTSKTNFTPIKRGNDYSAKCPAHSDSHPSLSISQANDGKILMNCFTGCTIDDICASLDLKQRDLFPNKIPGSTTIRTEYHYKDEQGNTLYWKVRLEPGLDGKSKSFYWERKLPSGQLVKNLKDCRKILYRLPELIQGISKGLTVYLVEGEKDADKLYLGGCIATTATEALFWNNEYVKILSEADVVILYDADKAGLKRKDLLCKNLFSKIKRLRVVDLPGIEYSDSHGRDISDWLLLGHTIPELLKITANTPDYSFDISLPQKSDLNLISLEEFLTLELPKREILLSPFLPTQGLGLVYAKRGVGKTHVAMGIAYNGL
jgi:putative DNA primase/helicase